MTARAIFFILVAYICGSIPFSHLITKWRTGLAIHEVGEGNVGSRNVWHVAGPTWGALAFVFDTLKGLGVYLGGLALGIPLIGIGLAGIAVVLGHQFSIFLHGQGGKGLATIAGFLLGLSPLSTLSGLALMALSQLILRNFNRSIVVCALGIIFLPLLFRQPLEVVLYAMILALLAGFKKLLDRQHEAQVWATRPWQDNATPGFHQAEGGDQTAPQDARPQ